MIESLIADRLETVAENVYPDAAPQGYATPCVAYARIDTEAVEDLDGPTGQSFVTFQFSISSPMKIEALTIARDIRESLSEWDNGDVRVISWIDEAGGVDNTTDVTLYREIMFFRFFCNE